MVGRSWAVTPACLACLVWVSAGSNSCQAQLFAPPAFDSLEQSSSRQDPSGQTLSFFAPTVPAREVALENSINCEIPVRSAVSPLRSCSFKLRSLGAFLSASAAASTR